MNYNNLIIAAVISFVIAAIFGPILIPVLHKLKFGQEIREVGPSWHRKKSGTPTMGGFIFIIPAIVCSFIFLRNKTGLSLLLFSLSFGFVGFIDDYIKVVKKRNLGLTEKQKFLLQLLFSVIFVILGIYVLKFVETSVYIPFAKVKLDLGLLYIPLALFVVVGTTNSVNLTDGVDGLASSVTIIVCVFLGILGYIRGIYEVTGFNAIIASALAGFFIFNHHPAKVFMGDTGSLFLGGVVCFSALLLHDPLILIIAGGVYVLETLSVIIQVAYFKKTGKRIFKMSPIHHHFELCGWSEAKIVTVACTVTAILCIIAYFASI